MASSILNAAAAATLIAMIAAAQLQSIAAAPASTSGSDDIVRSLPGWAGALPSTWYSGFLDIAGSEKQLHYIFIEAERPLQPADAPLVLWLNGGPGCSSLEGLFYEHGPLVVSDAHAPPNINFDGAPSSNAKKGAALVRNPWAWSRAANMLYLEAPAGVGFSYSPNPADLNTGDNQTAADNLAALHSFFAKFPSFVKNDFYVSGESYGGVYVPTLSQKIYQDASFPGNMKGYLVGNGVFDFEQAAATTVPFAYGHGFVSTKLHQRILASCDPTYRHPSKECQTLLNKVNGMEVDMNGYDAYRTCYHPDGGVAQPQRAPKLSVGATVEMFARASQDKTAAFEWLRSLRESVPCINSVEGTKYLGAKEVREALHVEESPNTWAVCGGVNYTDDGVYSSMIAVHKDMLAKYSPRVLVYNGDVDPGCNYLWAEASVEAFGVAVSKEWRPWVYKDARVGEQLGGFVTDYQQDVTFATIHGAGHMSPQWRPEAAFNMLTRFLDRRPLS